MSRAELYMDNESTRIGVGVDASNDLRDANLSIWYSSHVSAYTTVSNESETRRGVEN